MTATKPRTEWWDADNKLIVFPCEGEWTSHQPGNVPPSCTGGMTRHRNSHTG